MKIRIFHTNFKIKKKSGTNFNIEKKSEKRLNRLSKLGPESKKSNLSEIVAPTLISISKTKNEKNDYF